MYKFIDKLIGECVKEVEKKYKKQGETKILSEMVDELKKGWYKEGMDKVVRYTAIYDLQDMKEIVKLLVKHKLITRIA